MLTEENHDQTYCNESKNIKKKIKESKVELQELR